MATIVIIAIWDFMAWFFGGYNFFPSRWHLVLWFVAVAYLIIEIVVGWRRLGRDSAYIKAVSDEMASSRDRRDDEQLM